jgi:NADH-quinone oxidoreductase subunit M
MPGIPGNGFVGEFTILLGAFNMAHMAGKYWAILAATGIVLGAAYMLWLYQRTIFGKVTKEENLKLLDLNFREVMTLLPLTVLAFWIGLYPKPFFNILDEPVNRLVQQIEQTHEYSESIVDLRSPSQVPEHLALAEGPGGTLPGEDEPEAR